MHINSETGLSQKQCKSHHAKTAMALYGFGTENGLNRYDGQQVVQFDFNPTTYARPA